MKCKIFNQIFQVQHILLLETCAFSFLLNVNFIFIHIIWGRV